MIDIYQPGRADPVVPYEDTIGAVADLIREGKVRFLGVSEVAADLVRRAHSVHPVTALEIEYSLACRFIEAEILPTARELGIGLVSYRVLADGLLTGQVTAEPQGNTRLLPPRLLGDNLTHSLAQVRVLTDMAADKMCTPAQLAVAWLPTRGDDIVPLVGSNRRSRLAENLSTLDVKITVGELSLLDHGHAQLQRLSDGAARAADGARRPARRDPPGAGRVSAGLADRAAGA